VGQERSKVSAVIATFNRRQYVRRAIESIMAQTVPVDEIIVVDDGSTDFTAEAIEQWYGAAVRVIRQENGGVSQARWHGVQAAQGDWIAFLDSDDEWTPDRNRILMDAATLVGPEVAWIFGDLEVVTDAKTTTTLYSEHGLHVPEMVHVFADALTVQYPFGFGMLQGSFIRRRVLLELGCFQEGLRHSEDVLAGYQVACRYRFAAVPAVVGKYFRTADLARDSLVVNRGESPDGYRARMLAFALVIESGRRRPWNTRYAAQARSYCKALAKRGPVPRRLAVEQFRYGGFSLKGMAFCIVAMFGRSAIQIWEDRAESRRRRLSARRQAESSAMPAT
jgi:glycosyltransferase involved in cell wall biosynthesis